MTVRVKSEPPLREVLEGSRRFNERERKERLQSLHMTIERLKEVIGDPNCQWMNLSTIKGYLGELLVRVKLEEEGGEIIPHGNQSGYDLEVAWEDKQFRIDVKTSTLKGEIKNFPKFWGWALRHENKNRKISCDCFVCLALRDDYTVESLFVVPANLLKTFPKGLRRFRGVVNGFGILPAGMPGECDGDTHRFFTKSLKAVEERRAIRVLPHERLKDVLSQD